MGSLDGNDKGNEPWYIGIDDPVSENPERAISDFDI